MICRPSGAITNFQLYLANRQLPPLGDASIACRATDAILDRIVHNAHRIDLKGDSMRRKHQNENLTHVKNRETMLSET
jgi:DNA replication protein DnaC